MSVIDFLKTIKFGQDLRLIGEIYFIGLTYLTTLPLNSLTQMQTYELLPQRHIDLREIEPTYKHKSSRSTRNTFVPHKQKALGQPRKNLGNS